MRMPRRPKKRCAKRGQNASTDPLVNPGDTAHCEPHGPASDPGNSNHRLVNLEKNPSSCGKDRAYATKNATVMLGIDYTLGCRDGDALSRVALKTVMVLCSNAAKSPREATARGSANRPIATLGMIKNFC